MCKKIMREMKDSAAHGLSMVYRKLHSAYGADFSIVLSPRKTGGMRVVVSIPAKKVDEKGGNDYGPHCDL